MVVQLEHIHQDSKSVVGMDGMLAVGQDGKLVVDDHNQGCTVEDFDILLNRLTGI